MNDEDKPATPGPEGHDSRLGRASEAPRWDWLLLVLLEEKDGWCSWKPVCEGGYRMSLLRDGVGGLPYGQWGAPRRGDTGTHGDLAWRIKWTQ